MKFLARFRSRGKKRSKLFRYGWKITLFVLIAGAGLALFLFYGAWAASFDMKKVGAMPERNTVFDVDGKIYSRLAGANRLRVSLDEVSPFFIDALLAREDTRFYQHPGVDWHGIFRALVRDILSGSAKEGASSITQQLARNSLPLGGRTLSRKVLEALSPCASSMNSPNSRFSSSTSIGFISAPAVTASRQPRKRTLARTLRN